jgi:hypothetical protein
MTMPNRTNFRLLGLLLCAFTLAQAETVLIEAESLSQHGGWLVDAQFMDQMGSPFLLAHGLGIPVPDATGEVAIPRAGKYKVWARTRDWVARWKAPGTPGRFQILLNGTPAPTNLGTEGADWHWQDGGTVQLRAGKGTLALHDLTGFDGRCDAIILTTDLGWKPPEGDALAAFRRQKLGLSGHPENAGTFDLVVVGGGMAGTTAAVAAARLGLTVALVQNRPMLGGNASSEIRVYPGGRTMLGPNPGLGALEHELDPGTGDEIKLGAGNAREANVYADEKKLYVVKQEKNLRLFLNAHAIKVEKSGGRISAVVARDVHTGKDLRFAGAFFADCTGDATLGFLAGAEFRVGRESKAETGEVLAPETPDKQVMGTSYMWYADETKSPSPFPETPWALEFNERTAQRQTKGDWNWEIGMRQDQIAEAEAIRDHGYRAIYGNWSFLKNHAENKAAYERHKMSWVAYVGGKRESRRLMGDVILSQKEMSEGKPYPDAAVSTTWSNDLHYPDPKNTEHFPGQEFRSVAHFVEQKPYAIPYRCFYSRNVENLFMAGRNISVTHAALGAVRVQRTTAMMGEVVGMAASLARKNNTTPRGVYEKHLESLKTLMQKGVGKEDNVNVAALVPFGFSMQNGGKTASWKPFIARSFVRILFHAAGEPATIEVLHNGFKAVRKYDMAEGDRWIDLGMFEFTGNGIDLVRLVRTETGRALKAEDVKFEVMRPDKTTVRTTVLVKPAEETR